MELGCAPAHPQHAGQQALGLEAAAHAILHDLPYPHEAGANLGIAAPGALAGEHQFMNLQAAVRPCSSRRAPELKSNGGSSRAAPTFASAPACTTKPPPML